MDKLFSEACLTQVIAQSKLHLVTTGIMGEGGIVRFRLSGFYCDLLR